MVSWPGANVDKGGEWSAAPRRRAGWAEAALQVRSGSWDTRLREIEASEPTFSGFDLSSFPRNWGSWKLGCSKLEPRGTAFGLLDKAVAVEAFQPSQSGRQKWCGRQCSIDVFIV